MERGRQARKRFVRAAVKVAAVWLLGGVVMTVVSAWTFAWWHIGRTPQWQGAHWDQAAADAKGIISAEWNGVSYWNRQTVIWQARAERWDGLSKFIHGPTVTDRRLPRWLMASRIPEMAKNERSRQFFTRGFGWPHVALSYTYSLEYRNRNSTRVDDGLDLRPAGSVAARHILPLHTHWAGFLVNTLCLGAPLAGLWLAGGALRRRLRPRRGGCPHCGYALDGLTNGVCPECGCQQRLRKD